MATRAILAIIGIPCERHSATTRLAVTLSTIFCAAACASAPPPPPPPPPAPPRTAHTVSAIVLVNHCSGLGIADAKLAEKEMNKLVEGCGSYTGNSVRFTAVLLAGGAIQFEPHGDETSAIPICVLSHPLKHSVHLKNPCALDVELEVTSINLPMVADGGP